MFTKSKEFQTASRERKIQLIEIDAYNALINYLSGKINLDEIQKIINELSSHELVPKTQLEQFVKDKIGYETYQQSMGKGAEVRNQIRNRMVQLTNSL